MADMEGLLGKHAILVLLVPNERHMDEMKSTMRSVTGVKERVCYVTLGKPYKTMFEDFSDSGVAVERVFFVDGATQGGKDSKGDEQVVYVSSPRALTELDITIKNVAKAGKIECVVFDSLSTLIIYEGVNTVVKFVHSLSSGLRAMKVSCIFVVIKSEALEVVLKDISMFVDKMIEPGTGDG